MITDFMASAKQIKARKAFVKKYAKKGKRGKSKSTPVKLKDKKVKNSRLPKHEMPKTKGWTS